jgi:hypothetical protein
MIFMPPSYKASKSKSLGNSYLEPRGLAGWWKAAEYWRRHIPANPYFNPEVERFTYPSLNQRSAARGTADTPDAWSAMAKERVEEKA